MTVTAPTTLHHLFVLGNPGTKRIDELAAAVKARPGWDFHLWSWQSVLEGTAPWHELRADGACWLRLESPGKNAAIEQALLRLGGGQSMASPWERLEDDEVASRIHAAGAILAQYQGWLGWQEALKGVTKRAVSANPLVRFTSVPGDVSILFDKHACQERLVEAGVPCPAATGIIEGGFAELKEILAQRRWSRVFLKPCHGSSASGMVALEQSSRHGWRASTTAEMLPDGAGCRLFNRRDLQTITDPGKIELLCDAVCRHRAYAQQWVPKAGWQGLGLDFRVVVIGGRACHVVPRLSRHPMTNLQLGGRRGDAAALRRDMGEEAWARLIGLSEQAAAVFPRTRQLSLDVAASGGFRRFVVLEANAFGDFLPGALWEGRSTYDLELDDLERVDSWL